MILSRVVTAIVSSGVVIAGIALWRIAGVNRARWAIAAIATYGVVAFAHAMIYGIPLRAALSGQGLFQSIPYVIQPRLTTQ